jgi:hypothetical protein
VVYFLHRRQPEPARRNFMKNTGARCALCLVLSTVGFGLILMGISWMTLLGVAFIILSRFYLIRPAQLLAGLTVILVLVVLRLTRGGNMFSRMPLNWWFISAFIGLWLWRVISELRRWRQGTNLA